MERIIKLNSILVTGSQGFVGRRLVKKLQEYGVKVIEFDIQTGRDILSFASFDDVDAVDIVIHLAAKTFVPDAFAGPADMYSSNILGTLNILEYCRLKSVKKVFYVSSYIYGVPDYLPVDEKHPANIQNPYGRSKLIGEILCKGYYQDYGIIPIIFRPFNIYGPGQKDSFLIPLIISQALHNDKIVIKDLSPKRDYVYVDDIIDAYIKAIFEYQGSKLEVFNIGYGKSYSVEEIINTVQSIIGSHKPVVVEGIKRKNEIQDCIADITHIKTCLNWTPKYNLEQGLKLTISAYSQV